MMVKPRWMAFLCAAAVLLALGGCGGGGGGTSNTSSLVGVWSLRSIQQDNQAAVPCGQSGGCDTGQTTTFYSNGIVETYDGSSYGEGTWRLNGMQLTLSPGPGQAQAPPVVLTAVQSGEQLSITFVDTTASPSVRYTALFQRTSTQPPALVATANPPSISFSSGGTGGIGTNPNPDHPLSDFVGTWSGPWTTDGGAGGGQPTLETGTLTVMFSSTGAVTGQLVNNTTGKSFAITGTLFVDAGMTSGFSDAGYTAASGIRQTFLGQFFLATDGKIRTAISLDPLPQDTGFGNVVGLATLTRQ